MSASTATESYACMSGYSSSETEIACCAANRFAKSSRSRIRATVTVRVETQDLGEIDLCQPLTVEAHLRSLAG